MVVPRQPAVGSFSDLGRVALQLRQIIERIDAVELAGVNQAQIEIADLGSVLGLVEEAVLAQEDRFFQDSFTEIIMCALLRHVESSGGNPDRQCFVPAGSTWGGPGGDKWTDAIAQDWRRKSVNRSQCFWR